MPTQAISQAVLSKGIYSCECLNRLTKGTTSNDSAKGCTTHLGNGNYDDDYVCN